MNGGCNRRGVKTQELGERMKRRAGREMGKKRRKNAREHLQRGAEERTKVP